MCVYVKLLQSCPTLRDPVDCSQPGFSVRGIFQAGILEWFAMFSSRGSSWPRDQTHISYLLNWQVSSLSQMPPGRMWSQLYAYISPSSWTSLPTPHPSSSSHSPELSFLCYTAGFHQLSILHMVVWVSVCVCVCVCESLRCVWLFAIPWTVACQASLSMEFSRQEYWSG